MRCARKGSGGRIMQQAAESLRDFDVRFLDYFGPLGDVALHDIEQARGFRIADFKSLGGDAISHLGIGQHGGHVLAPAREHILRQQQSVPFRCRFFRQRRRDCRRPPTDRSLPSASAPRCGLWYLCPRQAQTARLIVSACRDSGLLRERGVHLGFPYSSDVKGSKHGQMRELRVQHRACSDV